MPAEELGPAITGSLMEIRSKAATIGAVKSMSERWRRGRWRRRRDRAGGGEGDEGGASRCSSAPSRSVRVLGMWVRVLAAR